MSEEEQRGLIGLANNIAGRLGPAFLMLVLLNTGFLGIVMWFLNSQLDQRLAIFNRIVDHCFLKAN